MTIITNDINRVAIIQKMGAGPLGLPLWSHREDAVPWELGTAFSLRFPRQDPQGSGTCPPQLRLSGCTTGRRAGFYTG